MRTSLCDLAIWRAGFPMDGLQIPKKKLAVGGGEACVRGRLLRSWAPSSAVGWRSGELQRLPRRCVRSGEANDIEVPHIHGWVAFPKALVMDGVETDDRAPGMVYTAIDSPDTLSEAQQPDEQQPAAQQEGRTLSRRVGSGSGTKTMKASRRPIGFLP